MGNNGSANCNSSQCTGKGAPGLNQYCYTTGYEHARPNSSPDAVGESLGVAPCITNANANQCYANGYRDGMSDNRTVSKGSNETMSNGDRYNNGKLASFVYDGQRHSVRRPGPR